MVYTAANQTYFCFNIWTRFKSAGFFGMGKIGWRRNEQI